MQSRGFVASECIAHMVDQEWCFGCLTLKAKELTIARFIRFYRKKQAAGASAAAGSGVPFIALGKREFQSQQLMKQSARVSLFLSVLLVACALYSLIRYQDGGQSWACVVNLFRTELMPDSLLLVLPWLRCCVRAPLSQQSESSEFTLDTAPHSGVRSHAEPAEDGQFELEAKKAELQQHDILSPIARFRSDLRAGFHQLCDTFRPVRTAFSADRHASVSRVMAQLCCWELRISDSSR